MILIADSGSTKTDWRLIDPAKHHVSQARTPGINPFFQTADEILAQLKGSLLPQINHSVEAVFFYGAGCAGTGSAVVRTALQAAFAGAAIEVESDMLGAARGACGREAGIACILGTGANNALYDGANVVASVPSLGFWLGDEGSGGYLGKTIVVNYLHRDLPPELSAAFERRFTALDRTEVLENAYHKPFPNRYFASFSKFLFDNRAHPYVYKLIYDSFALFLKKYVCKHPQHQTLPVSFVGSVAFYYSDILRHIATDAGISVKNILETPIAGLTLYHQNSAAG